MTDADRELRLPHATSTEWGAQIDAEAHIRGVGIVL